MSGAEMSISQRFTANTSPTRNSTAANATHFLPPGKGALENKTDKNDHLIRLYLWPHKAGIAASIKRHVLRGVYKQNATNRKKENVYAVRTRI
jgi:hypothetical protein